MSLSTPSATEPRCEILSWDTAFFGFRVGRLHGSLRAERAGAVDEWCRANDIGCLYFLTGLDDTESAAAAEASGFTLVGERVTLSSDSSVREPTLYPAVRRMEARDLAILESIASRSHHESRFYADPNFPAEKCDELYARWIRRSCENAAATVFVVCSGSAVVGYITCETTSPTEGAIGLFAVAPATRGSGLGTQLVHAALDHFARSGVQRVTVVTQGRNRTSQRVYGRCGFQLVSTELWYHRWFAPARQLNDTHRSIHTRIPFNKPALVGREFACIQDAITRGKIAGDGYYTRKCERLLEAQTGTSRALLATSCTHALEMSALLLDIRPGDEVIVPSFTFVSTANAFVLRGAKPVFADSRPDTLNLDESRLEQLITPRTRAIVAVHYAGVGCDMDRICRIAAGHGVPVVEDNAHGLFGKYRGKPLGSFGALATQSFHETKNISCGEGGALLINDSALTSRAEILREKGTDRTRFFRGEVDKYTWVDVGSSYVLSDCLAAFLFAQLEQRERIQAARRRIWERYGAGLRDWAAANQVSLPQVPADCEQPYHMFYLLLPTAADRNALIESLGHKGILAVFHYVPLHLSPMGERFGGRPGQCPVAESASERLVRLPFYVDLTDSEIEEIIAAVRAFRPAAHSLVRLAGAIGARQAAPAGLRNVGADSHAHEAREVLPT